MRKDNDKKKVENIVDFLCSESGSHDYTINRREAQELGLCVEKCDDVLYRTVKKISSSYSQELGFRDSLKINELLLQNADSLPSELMGKTLKFEYPRAVIESLSHKAHYFVSRGTLEIIKDGDKISIQEKRKFAGWEVRS